MLQLFAEVSEDRVAVLLAVFTTVSTAIGGAAVWIVGQFLSLRKARQTREDEKEKTIVEHLQDQVTKLEDRVKRLEEELKQTTSRLTQSVSYCMYAQALMDANRVEYKPFSLDSLTDSSSHPALAEIEEKERGK